MKNITKHFNQRWVERIVGITDERELKEYIAKNQEMIHEHANTTFEHSTYLYKGQLGDNITRNYHIKDDIVFVTNTTDDAFITCYKVDLGFTEDLNSTVRKGLVEEIKKLSDEKDELEFKILEEVEEKEHQALIIDDNIKIVESQLENLKKQKNFIEQEVKFVRSKSLNVGLDLKRFVLMLVNSKDYKKDLQTMK